MTCSSYSIRVLSCTFAIACLPLVATAGDEIRPTLESRYKDQKLKVVPPKVLVGVYHKPGMWITDTDFNVHYDHFATGVQKSKKYEGRNDFDESTTESVQGEAEQVDHMEPGETVQVLRIATFKRGRDLYMVDLMLKALAGKRLVAHETALGLGAATIGVHFRFTFPVSVLEQGDYQTVVNEINKYFLPVSEYKAAAAEADAKAKNINIEPGMSKQQVIAMLGQPVKTITFGDKTTLKYADITVELQGDKVINVKTQ
jgi:hypothetical protein